MKVKIDTKEKFHVISVNESILSANMTDEIKNLALPLIKTGNKNVIINLQNIHEIDLKGAVDLLNLQQEFYENDCSFVICGLQPKIEQFLDENQLLEEMNITPTESEAWDIVQLEEMERDLFNEENEEEMPNG